MLQHGFSTVKVGKPVDIDERRSKNNVEKGKLRKKIPSVSKVWISITIRDNQEISI
jgi:hypothetical protein